MAEHGGLLCPVYDGRGRSTQRRQAGIAGVVPDSEEVGMKLRQIALAVCLAAASSVAAAFHCPQDMKKIDDALAKNTKLSDQVVASVMRLRARGETLHKDGKHQEAVDTLARAKKLLSIE
jgi:hypothetical protein